MSKAFTAKYAELRRGKPRKYKHEVVVMGVGMPNAIYLEEFGQKVRAAFPDAIGLFHVGSSLEKKRGWRDVDVRLILEDDVWDSYGFGHPDRVHTNKKWVAMVMAFSALGKKMTGLPIDFQIQQMSDANERHPGAGLRSSIGHMDRITYE